jgi:hypothetical protein
MTLELIDEEHRALVPVLWRSIDEDRFAPRLTMRPSGRSWRNSNRRTPPLMPLSLTKATMRVTMAAALETPSL